MKLPKFNPLSPVMRYVLDRLHDLESSVETFYLKDKAADYLGVTEDSIDELIALGEITAYRASHTKAEYIRKSDLNAFILRMSTAPPSTKEEASNIDTLTGMTTETTGVSWPVTIAGNA